MATDADGNYYYDEGTLAELFDSWEIYEDADGNVGFYNGTGEVRLHELAFVMAGTRGVPTTDDLADGEHMLYVSDGTGPQDAGDLVQARNNSGSIETLAVTDALNFA